MLNYIRINRSDAIVIHNFYEIVKIAKTLKGCKLFLLSLDGYMYGIVEDFSQAKYVKVPEEYIQSFNFVFRIDSIKKDNDIEINKNYLFFPNNVDTNWFLISEDIEFNYLQQSINFNIGDNDELCNDEFKLDLKTDLDDNIINKIIPIYFPKSDKIIDYNSLNDIVKGVKYINTLPISFTYNNFQTNEIVSDIDSHKVNYGRRFLTLKNGNKKYIMSLDKNIITLNKNDTVDMDILDNPFNKSIYHAIFRIHKHKNPIPKIVKGKYDINIVVSYFHIS